ncbi:hypothetical protein [Aquimarina aquimarini]|uniref:hypothetical protein n=1 Tax=Aquimarina aquimarini TaxID=1191734 RepID=UPI000D562950|nr:hypothetical protein [Aquimarina aquimarini]
MIEILALSYFIKQIKKIAEEKGIKAGKWIAILVGSWFGSEILIFIIAFVFFNVSRDQILIVMLPALLVAAGVAYFILNKVKALPSQHTSEQTAKS